MKRICLRTSLLCYLMLLVFSDTSEALFFHYPKRVLMDFLEHLGGHKQMPPIHHYHMHYFPVPLVLPKPIPPPPPKIEIALSSLHSGYGNQLYPGDWSGRGSFYEPELTPSGNYAPAWPEHSLPWADSAAEAFAKADVGQLEAKSAGNLFLQVPSFHQRIVLYQPPATDTKSKLFKTFLSKLRRINDALFHPEDEPATDTHNTGAVINNSLGFPA